MYHGQPSISPQPQHHLPQPPITRTPCEPHASPEVPDYDTDAWRHMQYTLSKIDFSPLQIFDFVHGPLQFNPGHPPPHSFSYCSVNFMLLGYVLAYFQELPRILTLTQTLTPSLAPTTTQTTTQAVVYLTLNISYP